jgi:two-component sensor histidine kinase
MSGSESSTGQPVRHEPVRRSLPFDDSVGRVARQFVHDHIAWAVPPDLALDLDLIVNEIANNAFRHGAEPVEIVMQGDPNRVRIDISDRSPDLPRLTEPTELGGFGMHIVANLADDWGAHRTENGKVVWAEVRPHRRATER